MDLEAAVKETFEELEKYPNWEGFGELAAHALEVDPKFLLHPRVKDYYVKQGKWVKYLAKFVPEYAEYVIASE